MKITPRKLQVVLLLSMLLLVIGGVAIFEFGKNTLKNAAQDAAQTSADAQASQTAITRLQQIEKDLEKNKQVAQRASKIAAESREYLYQDQIIKDITTFATRNGLSIESIEFGSGTATGGSAGSAPSAPSGATSTPTGLPKPTTVAGGLKTVTATINLKSPINYISFLRFINDIEQNLTKMQLASLSLSASGDGLSSDALTIKVYVRG